MTRFKALYDADYLYVAAVLHPAPGLPTEAHFTRRNAPIYQRAVDGRNGTIVRRPAAAATAARSRPQCLHPDRRARGR